jgi:drug/metabolite transporter (DMT)-like permease
LQEATLLDDRNRGILWALAAAVGSAGFVIPWKLASSYGDTHLNALVLLASAALFNSLLSAWQGRSRIRLGQLGQFVRFARFDLRMAAALGLLSLVGNLFSAKGIELLSPALLAVVMRIEIVLVPLMAWPLIGERVEKRYWLGAGIAVVGLVLMQPPLEGAPFHASGFFWTILAAGCFSAMSVLTRMGIHRMDPLAVNGLRLWFAVGMWFALNGFPAELLEMDPRRVAWAALAAFFGPFAARLCLMMSARHVEARVTALATLGAPVITLALAYVILSDSPTDREIQGGLIMLIGIAIPIFGWTRAARP